MATDAFPVRCPCGSGAPYAACCGPLHAGRAAADPTATTAEALMRSRYSAYAVGDVDYLLASWHPAHRPRGLELEPQLEWRRLQLLATTGGTEHDTHGTVAFAAHFYDPATGRWDEVREQSEFVFDAGQWFYVGPVAGL